jgi:hypothetical protein
MNEGMGPEEEALHRAVGEVLHYLWDPCEVAGNPHARDEYDGYVGPVCTMLWQGATSATLSMHLVHVAEQSMGLSDTKDLADLAARRLVEWREAITR